MNSGRLPAHAIQLALVASVFLLSSDSGHATAAAAPPIRSLRRQGVEAARQPTNVNYVARAVQPSAAAVRGSSSSRRQTIRRTSTRQRRRRAAEDGEEAEVAKLQDEKDKLAADLAELVRLDERLKAEDAAAAYKSCAEATADDDGDNKEALCADAEIKKGKLLNAAQEACDDATESIASDQSKIVQISETGYSDINQIMKDCCSGPYGKDGGCAKKFTRDECKAKVAANHNSLYAKEGAVDKDEDKLRVDKEAKCGEVERLEALLDDAIANAGVVAAEEELEVDVEVEEAAADIDEDVEVEQPEEEGGGAAEIEKLQEEDDKLKADLAELKDLDDKLKAEEAAANGAGTEPDASADEAEPQDGGGGEMEKLYEEDEILKAELSGLKALDEKLKGEESAANGADTGTEQMEEAATDVETEKLQEEDDKLKADLAELEALDEKLKSEESAANVAANGADDGTEQMEEEAPTSDGGNDDAEPQNDVVDEAKLKEEEEKLKADLAKLEDLDEELKADDAAAAANGADTGAEQVDEEPTGGGGEAAEVDIDKLQEEGDKLKADLAELAFLSEQLKSEDAAAAQLACADAADDDREVICADAEVKKGKLLNDAEEACDEAVEFMKEEKCAEVDRLEGLLADAIDAIAKADINAAEEELEEDEQTEEEATDGGEDAESQDEVDAEKLQEEEDKLKADLDELKDLDQKLKAEDAATNDADIESEFSVEVKPGTVSPEEEDEKDATALALVFEGAEKECREATEALPPQQSFQGSEAEIALSVEEACCMPPLYTDYCTPTRTPNECSAYLKCLEANRIVGVFLKAVQSEIDAAEKECIKVEGTLTASNIEKECCLPPYTNLLPGCIDVSERDARRSENNCDALGKCLEVVMLEDLRSEVVGYVEDEDEESNINDESDNTDLPGSDTEYPGTGSSSGHDKDYSNHEDEDYIYFPHTGGREEGKYTYEKKEEFNKKEGYLGMHPAHPDFDSLDVTRSGSSPTSHPSLSWVLAGAAGLGVAFLLGL